MSLLVPNVLSKDILNATISGKRIIKTSRNLLVASHKLHPLGTIAQRPYHLRSPYSIRKKSLINSGCGPSQLQRRHITFEQLDATQGDRERIVILGSGWGGYPLSRAIDHSKFQAIIVSPRSHFVFTPLLAGTSVGTLEFRTALEPVRSRRSKTEYIQGWADDVDFRSKTVSIEAAVVDPNQALAPTKNLYAGKSPEEIKADLASKSSKGQVFQLKYDKLVIAVGCYSQTFQTPGVKENAYFLKDVGDARKIRKRTLELFEAAALPTTSEELKHELLNFAVVGGGPTGIEFSAELHDLIKEDMAKIYPDLRKYCSVTVYDVAPTVLPMFDKRLAEYAMSNFKREGISIRTSSQVEAIKPGLPNSHVGASETQLGMTLKIKGEPEKGVGMVVWSTGLMANPFIGHITSQRRRFPANEVIYKSNPEDAESFQWQIGSNSKSGSIMTNDRLRVILEGKEAAGKPLRAYMRDVFAIGDCAQLEGSQYPATAQVANQKGDWLAKRLNRNDLHTTRFTWKNMGTLAYIGNWKALLQGDNGKGISGTTAWIIWRGAYLVKSVSWRNRILIPVYW